MIRWFLSTGDIVPVLQYWHCDSYVEEWRDCPLVTQAQYELEIEEDKKRRAAHAEDTMSRLKGTTYTVR